MIVHLPQSAQFTGQLTWKRPNCGHEEMLDLDGMHADTLEGVVAHIESMPCLECKDVNECDKADQQRELEALGMR